MTLCDTPEACETLSTFETVFINTCPWPPFVACNYQLPLGRRYFNKATRDDYNGTVARGATPVFTAFGQGAGQGTLWVGTKIFANNITALRANDISTRMSCLGYCDGGRKPRWGVRTQKGFTDLHVFNSQGILDGQTALTDVIPAVRAVDRNLEEGRSVLVFCIQGARRSVFFMLCYLKFKCRTASGQVYSDDRLWGYLKLLRSLIEGCTFRDLQWAWRTLGSMPNPCEHQTLLPVILSDARIIK